MIDSSFVIPVYNAEKTIDRCIKSITNINKNEIEIIIVDDGSTDETSSICKEHLNDKRIKYFRKDNGGVASARNYGIKKAQGKYIFFVDSDDEIDSRITQRMLDKTLQMSVDWAVYGYTIVKNCKKTECPLIIDNQKEFNGVENIIQGYVWGKFYKTKIIVDNFLMFDTKMNYAEDMLFNLNYSMFVHSCISIEECGYYYYLSNSSLSRRYCDNYIESMEKIKEAFKKLFDIYPSYEEYYEKKFGSIELSMINGIIRNELRNKQNKNLKNKFDFIKKEIELVNINNIEKETIKGMYNKLAVFVLKTNSTILIFLFYSLINCLRG